MVKKQMVSVLFVGFCLTLGCATAPPKPEVTYTYPQAPKGDVVEDYHGTKVADPYRWLEDPDSDATRAWVEAENKLTMDFVRTEEQKKIQARLTELWNYPKYSLPRKEGGKYFFYKNDGLQNQDVLYVQDSLEGEPRVVIDPNKFSEDGTVALSGTEVSEDGKYMVYKISTHGSDWQEMKIRKLDSGEDFSETLKWCRFSSVAWKHDGSGFFYNRFPAAGEVEEEDRNNYNRVYFHVVGTTQDKDVLVYGNPDDKELSFYPEITEDGKYVALSVHRGTSPKTRFYYREVESDGPFVRLLDLEDAKYEFLENSGTVFYFRTDLDAPKGRVISIDVANTNKEDWQEIIKEQEDAIHFATIAGNHLVVAYMHHARDILKVFDLEGQFVRDLETPGMGSIRGLSGKKSDHEMFFGFVSYLHPESAFKYDFQADEVALFRSSDIDFDAEGYETKQVFCKSKDGTRVPMFITHKKGLVLDGNNPTVLYGYGGFNVSMTPHFSIPSLMWMENGGVFAVANLRGGAEYGQEWHEGGILENKQNVFDDFIAAAKWLIDNKYSQTSKLAIMGGSNGGLLTAACMLQRPDLFGAVISAVPVIDMLRYHKFSVGRYWVSDYGNAEESEDHFNFMIKYSPLHNVKQNVAYPPTLITTADTDDRVAPMHAKKFAATLQAADVGKNPILIRVETKAGHGGGKPTTKRIEEASDMYAFLFRIFDMEI